jgi:DNA-binding cell septation regulator SpoVG
MSFNIGDFSRITNDKSVICDYYDCSIYFHQYERTPSNGGYVKIPYFTPENVVKPNVLYISREPTIKYMSNTMYIHKKTHNINGIAFDGELIIENKRITNGDGKIFICFPLKTTNNINTTPIDKIIERSEKQTKKDFKITININSMFKKLQKYFFYKSGNDIVVVFTEPVKVKRNFDKFQKCNLFAEYVENYNILQNVSGKDGFQNLTEGFVEGMGIMDCQPIDITTNKPIVDAGTLVSINSKTSSENKTVNILFTMILFTIIFLLCIFGATPLYDKIFKGILKDDTITSFCIFSLFYLFWALSIAVGGLFIIEPQDTSLGTAGVFFLFLWFISLCVIFYMKKNDTEMFNIDNSIFFQTVKFIFTKYFVKIDTGRFVWGGIFNDYKWGGIFTCIVWIVTIILFILVNSKKKGKKYSSAIGKESSSNRKLTIYKNYSNAMLSIFGFGYSLLVVGPFVGYITANP